MSTPASHKLAPFLTQTDYPLKGFYAGYATVLTSPFEKGGSRGILILVESQGSGEIPPNLPFPKGGAKSLLDLYCVDHESYLQIYYIFDTHEETYRIPDNLHIKSLTHLYASANWLERECFDLFGVYFEGHPNLKRLIMYPEFAGNPLRKSYPIHKCQPLIPMYA